MSYLRSYIEIDLQLADLGSLALAASHYDPIKTFVNLVRQKYKCTDEIENTNYKVLKNFINNGHISKSSIIWKNDIIYKIYDIKVDNTGRIKHDKQKPPDKPSVYVAVKATEVNLLELKNAILRAKQAAI